jgi:hypothetical protein
VVGKYQGARAHPLGYPDQPEAAYGGTATAISGGDSSGSDGQAAPMVSGSVEECWS